MKPDVVVVGAGIIGSMVAVTLQDQGLQVLLLDAGFQGQATRASGGMLAPTSESHNLPPSWRKKARQSLQLWQGWLQRFALAGLDVDHHPGLGHAPTTPAEVQLFRHKGRWIKDHPSHPMGLAHFPDEGSVDPEKVLQALHSWCPPLQAEVLQVQSGPAGVQVHTAAGVLEARQVVLACGAWSGFFGIPVQPIQGQALLCKGKSVEQATYKGSGYLVPRTGRTFVGATSMQSWSTEPTPEAREQLEGHLMQHAPQLDGTTVLEQRVGLRPYLPEPWVDLHPTLQNVVVATGHFRNGVLLGPITAQQVALLLRETSSASYLPSLH